MSQCQQRVNQTLSSKLAVPLPSAQLLAAMQYAGLGAGQRIRPVLVYGSNQAVGGDLARSEERRVGKECRSRRSPHP